MTSVKNYSMNASSGKTDNEHRILTGSHIHCTAQTDAVLLLAITTEKYNKS
jgi:hypothetical protein